MTIYRDNALAYLRYQSLNAENIYRSPKIIGSKTQGILCFRKFNALCVISVESPDPFDRTELMFDYFLTLFVFALTFYESCVKLVYLSLKCFS